MKPAVTGVFAATAAIILLNACNPKAEIATPTFDEANVALAECRSKVMLAGINSSLSANELVNQAFTRCKELEDRFYAAGVAQFGTAWRKSEGDEQAKSTRQAMLVRINEIRSGKSASNPFIAWGNCTGRQSQIERSSGDPIDNSVERILAACKKYQDAVMADASQKLGKAQGHEVIDTVLPKIRSQLAKYLQTLRSQPYPKAPLAPSPSP